MRVFSVINKPISLLKGKTPYLMFSKVASSGDNQFKGYEDWQYCKMITNQLKSNNVHQALSLLFQSYFHNKILDMQIYNQLYEKIETESLPLSYAEILYEIYRQHFPPHQLMLGWMNKLTTTKSDRIIGKLKDDYKCLGEPYPTRSSRSSRRQVKRNKKAEKQQDPIIIESSKSQIDQYAKYDNFNNFQGQKSHYFNNPTQFSFGDQKMSPEELFHHKLSAQLKYILMQLNLNISRNTRVDVKGVKVQLMKLTSEEQQSQLPSDQEYQFQDNRINEQLKHLYGCDITKIQIEKLEFHNEKYRPF